MSESWYDNLKQSENAVVLQDDFGRMAVLNDWGLSLTFSSNRIDLPYRKALELAEAIQERYGDKAPQ